MGISFRGSLVPVGTFKIKTNIPPIWLTAAGSLGDVNGGQPYTFNLAASDPENAPLTYSLISGKLPTGLALSGNTISGTPDNIPGMYNFTVRISDGVSFTNRAFSLIVTNQTPVWVTSGGSLGSVEANSSISYSVVANDPNGDAITYSIVSGSLPSGLVLDSFTGAITGQSSAVGTENFTVRADDGKGGQVDRAFSITITTPSSGSVLLLNFNSAIDTSGTNKTVTNVGGVTFSGGKGYFASGKRLNVNASNDFNFGTGDFTVEIMCSFDQFNSSGDIILMTTDQRLGFQIISTGVYLYWGNGSPSTFVAQTLNVNTDYHFVLQRKAGVIGFYINGSRKFTTTDTSAAGSYGTYPLSIGFIPDYAGRHHIGSIDEVRILKGTAMYDGPSFTVPSSPLI